MQLNQPCYPRYFRDSDVGTGGQQKHSEEELHSVKKPRSGGTPEAWEEKNCEAFFCTSHP